MQVDVRKPSEDEFSSWFAGKRFSEDWVSDKIPLWRRLLAPLRDRSPEILEIGSFEGRSAVFFLNFLSGSTIVCVDPLVKDRLAIVEGNLAEFGDRARIMRDYSLPSLVELRAEGRRFDLIYIDGNHDRESVLLDSIFAWPMLRTHGIVIWDDYDEYGTDLPKWKRPQSAIDGFLLAHEGEYEILGKSGQMAVCKTVEAPNQKLLFNDIKRAAVPVNRTLTNLFRFFAKRPLKLS
jgi:predicted O-methyltransferase YrrM